MSKLLQTGLSSGSLKDGYPITGDSFHLFFFYYLLLFHTHVPIYVHNATGCSRDESKTILCQSATRRSGNLLQRNCPETGNLTIRSNIIEYNGKTCKLRALLYTGCMIMDWYAPTYIFCSIIGLTY